MFGRETHNLENYRWSPCHACRSAKIFFVTCHACKSAKIFFSCMRELKKYFSLFLMQFLTVVIWSCLQKLQKFRKPGRRVPSRAALISPRHHLPVVIYQTDFILLCLRRHAWPVCSDDLSFCGSVRCESELVGVGWLHFNH